MSEPRRKSTIGTERAGSLWIVLACGAVLLAGGCAQEELDTTYGRMRVPLERASVNGTDVLAGMFSAAGHQVASRRTLITSDLASAQTIVWFPDDYAAPSQEVCDWFDEWLSGDPGRTLVYVGREFDAAPIYWRKMIPLVSSELRKDYRERLTAASLMARVHAKLSDEERRCDWFSLEPEAQRDVHELTGPWRDGIDRTKVEIEIYSRIDFRFEPQRLLTSKKDLLVASLSDPAWQGSRLIAVTNGSFLLNLPLVNHEHRKLAGKLIAAVGPPGRVVFLESGRGGPPIDPPADASPLWSLFGAWPLNAILLQLAVLGIIFCFARWPIFGRPQQPVAESLSDFGKHVAAVGELLRRTKDRNYARARLAESETATTTKTRDA